MDMRRAVETGTGLAALVGSLVGAGLSFTGVIDVATGLSVILALFVAYFGYQMLFNTDVKKQLDRLSGVVDKTQGQIVTQREWYELLLADLVKAERHVLVTSHEPRLARSSGLVAKRLTWVQLQTMSKTTDIIFKWLVAIDDTEKLAWVEEVLDDLADRDNVSMAVVLLDSFDVPPLSVQVVDNKCAYVIDPRRGYHSLMDDDRDLVTRNPNVVQFFREYYDAYWDRATLVKEGPRIYRDRLASLATTP